MTLPERIAMVFVLAVALGAPACERAINLEDATDYQKALCCAQIPKIASCGYGPVACDVTDDGCECYCVDSFDEEDGV